MRRWDQLGIPHKGWILEGVEDIKEGHEFGEHFEYETCEMCQNERIRYVHLFESS